MKLGVKLMLINLASFNNRISVIIRILKLKNKYTGVLTARRLQSDDDNRNIGLYAPSQSNIARWLRVSNL